MQNYKKDTKNNSYETEPSSEASSSVSSGHSIHNVDYLETAEVDHIKLPLLLEPRNYTCENQLLIDIDFRQKMKSCKNISVPSSQESPFAGFRETPLKEMQEKRFFYEDTNESEMTKQTNNNDDDDVVYVHTLPVIAIDTAKQTIYETIASENSCNAVDMPLTSQEAEAEEAFNLQPQASDLSFNGKIKALDLNCSKDDAHDESIAQNNETFYQEQSLALNTSSLFKCGLSPDLFADDDDDENENVKNAENVWPCEEVEAETEVVVENVDEEQASKDAAQMDTSANRSLNCPTESSFADEATLDNVAAQNENNAHKLYRENCRRERELLRRIRKCLSGVPPPPSLTIPQLDLIQMVLERKADILNFFNDSNNSDNNNEIGKQSQRTTSLFKPTHSLPEAKRMPWRDILGVRQHGLCYNLSNASEHCEYLGLSVVERFVGAEATSSYRRSPSSAKKRNLRVKLLPQSPGNRLSHLAKRRAIFSSANLATTSQRSATALGPQIVIDKKKSKSRRKGTPKRKTPGSKKKTRKTPSSSARKLQFRLDLNKPAPSRESSKRALFQSPMEIQQQQQQQLRLPKPQFKPEIATKVEKSKRALFSPDAKTTTTTASEQPQHLQIEKPTTSSAATQLMESSMVLKRKRNEFKDDEDDVEGLGMPSKKLLRCDPSSLTPRALKIKSQSFCIGAGSSDNTLTSSLATLNSAKRNLLGSSVGVIGGGSNNSLQSLSSAGSSNSLYGGGNIGGLSSSSFPNNNKLQRAQSDVAASSASLTENQKKKLLWAVSQALQEKKITTKHENFKQHATVLARVVRRIFQEFYQRTSTSNSETLLRLAKKYVFYVVSGRSCDDIYTQVRAEEHNKRSSSSSRLTGYIGPEEYQQRKQQQQQHLPQLSQTSMLSSLSSIYGSMQNLLSFDDTCSQPPPGAMSSEPNISQTTNFGSLWSAKSSGKQLSIEANASLPNSSSKSNLGSLALRENSAQKNFTGKDQRNVSPYAKGNSSLKLNSANSANTADTSLQAKAKRQILFDS